MTLRFFPRLAVLGLASLAASSSAALTGVRNGQRTFSPGQQIPIVCDQNDAVTNEIELSGATVSGAVRAEVPSPLTASVLDAGSGKAKIRITVPAGTSVGQRVLKVHSALAGVPPETVTLAVTRRPSIASFTLNQPQGGSGRLVIEGNDLTELVRSAAQAMLDVAGQPVQIDTGQPISVTSRRLELKLECKVDGPFTIRRRMFSGRGLDTLSAPGVGGGAPDKAGTCAAPSGPLRRKKVD